MIFELLERGLTWLMGSSGQTTVILVLALAAVYFRKAIGLGSVLADWTGKVVFTLIVLVALLLTGIVPGLDVDALFALIYSILDAFHALLDSLR